jgi:hypothetical protein
VPAPRHASGPSGNADAPRPRRCRLGLLGDRRPPLDAIDSRARAPRLPVHLHPLACVCHRSPSAPPRPVVVGPNTCPQRRPMLFDGRCASSGPRMGPRATTDPPCDFVAVKLGCRRIMNRCCTAGVVDSFSSYFNDFGIPNSGDEALSNAVKVVSLDTPLTQSLQEISLSTPHPHPHYIHTDRPRRAPLHLPA